MVSAGFVGLNFFIVLITRHHRKTLRGREFGLSISYMYTIVTLSAVVLMYFDQSSETPITWAEITNDRQTFESAIVRLTIVRVK